MKICIVTTSFPRWPDDHRSPYIHEAASAIQRLGHAVRILTMHYPGSKTREMFDGIEVIRTRYLPERWEILQKKDGGLPIMWQELPLIRPAILPFFLSHALAIARYARDCDLIHANWSLSGMAAWYGHVWHRKPYIITVHGSDIFHGTQIPFANYLTRTALNASAQVISVSSSLAEAVARLGIARSKITVVSDGVNTRIFCPTVGPRLPIILFVGALTENKGIRFLLEALPMVLRQFNDFRLVLIGDGPQRVLFEELANSLYVRDKVDFLGSQTQIMVSYWMQRARLCVLPSLSEGLGVSLLEALASGTPCVGTRVGGIPDVITKEVGLLVPPADPAALGEAIVEILTLREDNYHKMSHRAHRRALTLFDWKIVAPRIIEIYKQAL